MVKTRIMTIKNNHIHPSLHQRHLDVVDFPIKDIKIPKDRIREEDPHFKETPKYKALRINIATLGLHNPISIKTNCELVEGFYRINIGKDLGWKTIPTIIDDLTKKEARLLEFGENFFRINFTDFEIYKFIGELKRDHEEEFPESKRGKYNRGQDEKQDHKTIIPPDGNMINNSFSFVDTYSPILGLRKSALYNKAQIGEAILNETFHPKTIRAIKEERITQRQLLHKLRQRQNSKVISEGLRDISKTQGSTIKKTLKIKIKLPKKESPEKIKQSTPFEKEKKIIKAAHKDRLAHQIMNQVEKGEISLDTAVEQVDTIENLNKSRIKHVIEDQKKVGKKFEEYTHELRLKPVNRKAGQYKEDRCGSCSLAHLYIAICFKCGEVAKCLNCQSPIFQVICEKDIIERTWNLRDPNLAKCNNSPAIKKKK